MKREVEIIKGAGDALLVSYVDRKKGGKHLAAQFSGSTVARVREWIAKNPKLTEKPSASK